ncbi:XRE family transcriptional regulator [Yunchengibacter salinarum]|uniref:XRE family transcriptional regulator n=1 Tax=Yunchengibacter salinarum TaxID=3133399 RepID=UPI0035B69797
MKTQEWIKGALRERGYKLKDVADRLGITPPRVSEILRGARDVQSDEILPLADMLGMSAQALLESLSRQRKVDLPRAAANDYPAIPVLGILTGTGMVEPLDDALGFQTVPIPPDAPGRDGLFCYVMGDDSMAQEIPKGSLIIAADPRQHFFPMVPGAIFLMSLPDGRLAPRQYLRLDNGEDWLVPTPKRPNPAFESYRLVLSGQAAARRSGEGTRPESDTERPTPAPLNSRNIFAGVVWVHHRHMPG